MIKMASLHSLFSEPVDRQLLLPVNRVIEFPDAPRAITHSRDWLIPQGLAQPTRRHRKLHRSLDDILGERYESHPGVKARVTICDGNIDSPVFQVGKTKVDECLPDDERGETACQERPEEIGRPPRDQAAGQRAVALRAHETGS